MKGQKTGGRKPSTPNKTALKNLDDLPRLVMVLNWFEELKTLLPFIGQQDKQELIGDCTE